MKILHTSDWHIGKTLRGRSRIDEQAAVLAEIVSLARSNNVDVAIVAGDVFDTAAPGPDAERVAYRALLELARTGANVIVLSGNHDNDRRLQAVQPVFDRVGVLVRPMITPEAINGVTRAGEPYRCAALPWIAKHNVVKIEQLLAMDDADAQQHYAARVRLIIEKLCESMKSDVVNLLAGHMAMPLDDVGEEVRQAQIMDYVVPSTVFSPLLHYVALGHYHRPIEVAGPCSIRYSGAPMWLGFPRREHENEPKGVYIVDAAPGLPPSVEFHAVTAGKRLRTLRGSMDELEALSQSNAFDDMYLRIFVRDQSRAGLAKQVRQWFPDAVDVTVDPEKQPLAEPRVPRAGRAPGVLFREYLTEQQAIDERVTSLFDKLLDEAHAPDPA